MKQKPILFLLLSLFTITGISQRTGHQSLRANKVTEGTHPKNVSLAITCPNGVFVQTDASCQATVITPTPTSSCNITFMSYSIGGGPVRLVNPVGGIYPDSINLGVYGVSTFNVVWFVIDDCAASATCTQTVFVLDSILPEIGCPLDITVANSTGSTSGLTQVSIDLPKVSDNCTLPGEIVLENNYNLGPDASGGYPVGITTVCWTAIDQSGNTASCCMNVFVLDDTRPVIVCPDTLTVDCEAPAPIDYFVYFERAGGTATDETALDTTSFAWVRDSLTQGQCVFEKTILRYYTISDTSGNADTCFQVLFVQDTLPPTAICRDITVYVDETGSALVSLDSLNNNSFDACSDTLLLHTNHSLVFTCAQLSEATSVSITFTDDCGNASSCISFITVADTLRPGIGCPPNITVMPDPGLCSASGVKTGEPDAADNCKVTRITAFLNQAEVDPATIYPSGIHTLVWIASDQSGNTGSCEQLVTVFDNEPPLLACPPDMTINADPDMCDAIVQYSDPVGEDNCSAVTITIDRGFPSGQAFPVGTTEVRFIGVDENLNADTCSFYITVIDIMDPEIDCPANIIVSATTGQCGRVVTYTEPEATDNCPGVALDLFSGQASGTFFPVGTTSITYQATAANGMTASCTFTVRVNDNQLPAISCPANISTNSAPGQCGAVVTFTPPIGTDNCPGPVTILQSGQPSGTFFNAGITTNIYRVTDASGNSVACQFTVTVSDNIPPQITCPSAITVNNVSGQCGANVTFTSPVGTDNCPGVSTLQSSGLVSGAFFPVGTTSNVFRVTAANGASSTCSFFVVVQDAQAPTILCPASVTVNAVAGQCAAPVTYGQPTANDNCPGFSLSRIAGPATGATFNVGTTPITYVVTAANQATASCSFTVTVIDNQPPSVSCPAPRDITLSSSCSVQVPDLTSLVSRADNCGPTTLSQVPTAGAVLSSAHNMQHTITMTAADQSGQTSTCTVVLTAKDLTGPQVTCAGTDTIYINDTQTLPAAALYTAASDNCGGTLSVQVRRSGTVCGGASQDVFGSAAQFCCEDVSKNISFIVQATDQRGNTATCVTTIRVEDNTAPVIIEGLPDITISCKFPVDVRNLDVFGTLVDSPSKRKPILIQDEYYPTGIAGQDGLFSENCSGALVSYTVTNNLSTCRTGTLIRTFIVRDKGNNMDTITQRIEIINNDQFTAADITWPGYSVQYNQCNDDDPDTSVTGAPILRSSYCDLVAATYKDQTFLHPTFCKYVKRTWTVIDWCQYKTNMPNTPGKWTFTQHIYITNSVAPVISNQICRDTIVCIQDNACSGKVSLTAQGTDDCLPLNIRWSYTIDVNNDGGLPEMTGTGDKITGDFQQGSYRVVWTAKDGCSNQSQCSFVFTVRDCKKPTAVAKQGLAVSLSASTGTALIHASDFNNLSSDNCTAVPLLKYSFSKNTAKTSINMTCDSVGRRKIQFWVTDLAGNQAMVETFITVQDNHRVCSGGTGGRMIISGHVFTEEKRMIEEAGMILRGTEVEGESKTDAEGKYTFTNLPADRSYQLSPDKQDNMLQGISTLDLVLIQRHVLGISPLSSPYKLIAADVNGSGTITASDIVELRKMMLGVQAEFSKKDPWRFVDAEYTFNESNIWQYASLKEVLPTSSPEIQADFVIVKTGDVNGTVSQGASGQTTTRNTEKRALEVLDTPVNAFSRVRIPVFGRGVADLVGFQIEIALNNEATVHEIIPGTMELDKNQVFFSKGEDGSTLRIIYNNTDAITVTEGAPLFYLELQASKAGMLHEVLSLGGGLLPLAVTTDMAEEALQFVVLPSTAYQDDIVASPNPFSEQTMVAVQSDKSAMARVTIFDTAGKIISQAFRPVEPGQNNLSLTADLFGESKGLLYCRIEWGSTNQTIKLLRVQ